MTDNDVIKILIPILRAGLDGQGQTTTKILQSYQPTQQGIPVDPVVYLHKIPGTRRGYPGDSYSYNDNTQELTQNTNSWRLPQWQVNARSVQDPEDINSFTSSDLVNLAADILQWPTTIETLQESEIGIYFIGEIRNLYTSNDRQRFEQIPSFDFTVSYNQNYSFIIDGLTEIQSTIHGIS